MTTLFDTSYLFWNDSVYIQFIQQRPENSLFSNYIFSPNILFNSTLYFIMAHAIHALSLIMYFSYQLDSYHIIPAVTTDSSYVLNTTTQVGPREKFIGKNMGRGFKGQ